MAVRNLVGHLEDGTDAVGLTVEAGIDFGQRDCFRGQAPPFAKPLLQRARRAAAKNASVWACWIADSITASCSWIARSARRARDEDGREPGAAAEKVEHGRRDRPRPGSLRKETTAAKTAAATWK